MKASIDSASNQLLRHRSQLQSARDQHNNEVPRHPHSTNYDLLRPIHPTEAPVPSLTFGLMTASLLALSSLLLLLLPRSKATSSLLLLSLVSIISTDITSITTATKPTGIFAHAMSTASTKRGALIFLHGLGDSPAGWSSLQTSLPSLQSRLADIEYVFPAAPTIPITINGGMTMTGWFDVFDWPIAVGSKDDPVGLDRSVAQIEAEVAKLEGKGIPASRIVVGGFSQGAAASLLAVYGRNTRAYAGCVCLSGWLTLPSELKDLSATAKATPLFWGHGQHDDKVLFPQQKFGVEKLREAGVEDVEDQSYPVGHSSHPAEVQRLAEFVDAKLFAEQPAGVKEDL